MEKCSFKIDDIFQSMQNQCHNTRVKKGLFGHTIHLRPKEHFLVGWVGGWKMTLVSVFVQRAKDQNGQRA